MHLDEARHHLLVKGDVFDKVNQSEEVHDYEQADKMNMQARVGRLSAYFGCAITHTSD